MVKNRTKVHFRRDGQMIEAVPTLKEAREVAEGIQLLLDIANGDAPSSLLFGKPH